MKKAFKHYRLLGSDNPDPEKVRQLFADQDDEQLTDALANPQHTEAAKAILHEIAAERGVQAEDERLWEQDEAAMWVKPFGHRPTVEQAMAAPRRWRLIYRGAQALSLVLLIVGIVFFNAAEKSHDDSVQLAIEAGQVDAGLVNHLKNNESLLDSEVSDYLVGRNVFITGLQEKYLGVLLTSEWPYAAVIQDRLVANESTAEIIPDAEAEAGDDVYFLQQAKSIAMQEAMEEASEQVETINTFATMGLPPPEDARNTLFTYWEAELDGHLAVVGEVDDPHVHNALLFDQFVATPRFEPVEHKGGNQENIAVALILAALALFTLVGIIMWRAPRRMLLLRPFQAKKLAKPLKRFVRKNMAFNGHTFTLSDKYVKESRAAHLMSLVPTNVLDIVLVPLSFIPYFRQFKRYLYAHNARSYNFLKKRMRRRKTLTRFWQGSWNKTLSTRCSDTWWRAVVDLLMYSCEIIVVDLSWVKSGTEWELGKIDVRDLERKTIFVVFEPKHENAVEVVHHFWPGEEAPPPMFVFDKRGRVSDAEGLQREMARIASESYLWDGPQGRSAREAKAVAG